MFLELNIYPGKLKNSGEFYAGILLTIGKTQVLSGTMFLLHTRWVERRRNS